MGPLDDFFSSLIYNSLPDNLNIITNKIQNIALADLANKAYKYILNDASNISIIKQPDVDKENDILRLLEDKSLLKIDILKKFIDNTKETRLKKFSNIVSDYDSYLPYIFPTRPLSPMEITELAPECVGLGKENNTSPEDTPTEKWAEYTQALRGICINPLLLSSWEKNESKQNKKEIKFINIGKNKKEKVVVAITSFETSVDAWKKSASNAPDLGTKRYGEIAKVVNTTLQLDPKPDYVIFPELSIPLHWLDTISKKLKAANISLIAGTEYSHSGVNSIISEAALILSDNRLGYPNFSIIRQPKIEPSINEGDKLVSLYGKVWDRSYPTDKPVYIHNGVYFGVMICSELLNSKARIEFQGNIDALMVLSWNKDLETFSSLIEASALDIHAYMILVNNRTYGDSRIRSPSKIDFKRDITRLRGGENNFVVTATLDISKLQAFQSRATRCIKIDDEFKPVPEGFKIYKNRKRMPPI